MPSKLAWQRTDEIVYDPNNRECLTTTLLNKDTSIEQVEKLLTKYNIDKPTIKSSINRIIEIILLNLHSPAFNKTALVNIKQYFEKATFLDKKYGPFQLKNSLAELNITIDLFEFCLVNNINTIFKPKLFTDLIRLLEAIQERIIDYGLSRYIYLHLLILTAISKLFELLKTKGYNAVSIIRKNFTTLISFDDYKEVTSYKLT